MTRRTNPRRLRYTVRTVREARQHLANHRRAGYGAGSRKIQSGRNKGRQGVYVTDRKLARARPTPRAKPRPAKQSRPAPKRSFWQRNFG